MNESLAAKVYFWLRHAQKLRSNNKKKGLDNKAPFLSLYHPMVTTKMAVVTQTCRHLSYPSTFLWSPYSEFFFGTRIYILPPACVYFFSSRFQIPKWWW